LAGTYINLGHIYRALDRLEKAERSYFEGQKICQDLNRNHPEMLPYGTRLANAQMELGRVSTIKGQDEIAFTWYGQALQTLEPFHRKDPSHGMVNHLLSTVHQLRASTMDKVNRYAEALEDWEKAVELDGAGAFKSRVGRAYALAHLKQHGRAIAEINALLEAKKDDAKTVWDAACIFSLSAAAAAQDGQLPSAQQNRLQEAYAGQAVTLLHKAKEARYFREETNLRALKKDTDLGNLRSREDFKSFLSLVNADSPDHHKKRKDP
jgi:tetratricopeptide (TPR) repeat protein